MEQSLILYGIAVQPEGDNTWSAYIRKNLFNEDGSEAFQCGATPADAVEKAVQYWLMHSGTILF